MIKKGTLKKTLKTNSLCRFESFQHVNGNYYLFKTRFSKINGSAL